MTTDSQYQIATEYLTRFYNRDLFRRGNQMHPALVYLPSEQQARDVDSVLASPPADSIDPESFTIYDWAYLHTLQNQNNNLYNGTTFALKKIRRSPLKISASLGTYYDMLATCASLENELWNASASRFIRLPNRAQFHRTISNRQALSGGAGRSAAIGVITTLIFNNGNDYRVLIGQRSATAATDPLKYYLFPSFIFQPGSPDFEFAEEWSVAHQIKREYLEELFAYPEQHSPDRYDYFYEHPAIQDLEKMLAQGDAELFLTGIVMNLLNMRAEICTLLIIHNEDWIHQKSLNFKAETFQQNIVFAPITSDESLLAMFPEQLHTRMPPQGTVALWLGIDKARKIFSNS